MEAHPKKKAEAEKLAEAAVKVPENFRVKRSRGRGLGFPLGGHVPADEQHVSLGTIIEVIARDMEISQKIVTDALLAAKFFTKRHGQLPEEVYTSVSGDTEYYEKDPTYDAYHAPNLKQLWEAMQEIDPTEFQNLDFDRIPKWGDRNETVESLEIDSENRSEFQPGKPQGGVISWDTRRPTMKYYLLYQEVYHKGKLGIKYGITRSP